MGGRADGRVAATRRLLAPGIATAVAVAILIALGVWQLQRLQWKTALLASIDRAEAAPPIPLPASPAPFTPAPFTKVAASGTFRPGGALYGSDVRFTPSGSRIGAFLLSALDRPGAPTLIVDRGWVPTDGAVPDIPAPPGLVTGYVRLPEPPGLFTVNDPASKRFFNLDPAAIGAAIGVQNPAPFTLVQLGEARPGAYPAPATALPRPPNDHLGYAITWFSLAAVALVTFVVYARKVLRP